MGIFNRIFSSSATTDEKQSSIEWIPLEEKSQLEEVKTLSFEKKVLIFKHSTRCGISRMVLKNFESTFRPEQNTVLYYLDLLNHRDISNAIAEEFEVRHESPQLLVIEEGRCTSHASHHRIDELVSN